jgi:hypothetical protein
MPVSLVSIRNELLPGLRDVYGKYTQIPQQWPQMFKSGKSKMAFERSTEMRFLGYAQIKNEGQATTTDNNAGERYLYNQEHQEIGLGYAVTRKAIDDNLYKQQFNPSNLGLQNSFVQTKEIYGANVYNTANVYNPMVGGDGQPLCSTVHPIDGNVVANTPTVQVDLSETSLLNAQISIRTNYRDAAGLKIYARAEKLIIPPALEPVAIRLLKTVLRPGTPDNDVNAILSTAGGLSDYLVCDYLTSPFSWFIKTNIDGLLYLERIPFEMDMQVDYDTDNLKVKGYERYSFSYFNWRSIWGSFPTS